MLLLSNSPKPLFLLLCIVLTISFASPVTPKQNVCRALVLQGGGDKGAYEAGVLYGLVNNARNPEDFQYDVITGVSVGSVNGMGLAMYDKGKEKEAVDYMIKTWRAITRRKVYKSWPLGIVQGLIKEPSIFNNDPLQKFLRSRMVTSPNKRRMSVLSVDINTGQYLVHHEHDWGNDKQAAADYALFSSSVPVFFKYRKFRNYTLVDGATAGEGMDIEDAVKRCKEIVDDDANIILDVIFANNVTESHVKAEDYKTMQVLHRYVNILKYVFSTRNLHYAESFFPNVNFRHVIIASERLPNQDIPLSFAKKNIEKMIALGIKDAVTTLNKGDSNGREVIASLPRSFIKRS